MKKKMQDNNVQGDFAFPQEKKARSASGELSDGLIYKADQDLARVKERFAAFWRGEIVDRVCLAVTAPSGANVPVPVAENDEQALTDPEFQVRRCNAEFANTWYGGDALPMGAAPGNLLYAAYGGKASFASGTVWVDPTLTDGQQGGKVQWIGCAPDEVELVLSALEPQGLFIRTWAPNIASAQALLKNAEKWSCRRQRRRG